MAYDAQITELPQHAVFDLKGPQSALTTWCGAALPVWPDSPNTLTKQNNQRLCHIGPAHWLLIAPMEDETALADALRPTTAPPEISLVQISDTLTFFQVTGADAPQILATGCPLDTHETVFPPNAVTYTDLFGTKALILREETGFLCAVDRSYTPMITDFFAHALPDADQR